MQQIRAVERGRGRRARAPLQIPWRGWKDVFVRTYREIQDDRLLALAAGVAQLDERLAPGGTGLYDAVLASVRALRPYSGAGVVSTVVVITDGRQDDPGGPALADVVATLQAEADPERPVRVVTVGISGDVDPGELRALAEATGGAAYLAEQPEDLPAVLADALRRR